MTPIFLKMFITFIVLAAVSKATADCADYGSRTESIAGASTVGCVLAALACLLAAVWLP